MPRHDDDDEDIGGDDDVDVSRKGEGKKSAALGRLATPAIILIVCAALAAAFNCISIPYSIYRMTQPAVPPIPPGQPGAEFNFVNSNPAASVGQSVVGLLIMGFIIFGAIQMKNGKMYGVSMAAAILSIIPCCSPCFCFGIPFGIWALIVLLDQNVKSSFTS